jgi:TP901 family phage tail tape measure protein
VAVVANVAINIDGKQAEKLLDSLEQKVKELNGQFKPLEEKSKGWASGLKAAASSAIGQLAAVTGAVFTLQTAFDTLAQQSRAQAALQTLGVNATAATAEFGKLSQALQGQASTVELTAAAYDVASAGFTNVADQTKILEASTKGAVGGLSDLNTVGNAVTSVLNAYGMSANQAGLLVDGFIQTQNDGKIVLNEYANLIGRLAPLGAAAGVGIKELNAAVATITAQGVAPEAAVTGLAQAISSILKPTSEAKTLAKELGIDFSETGLSAKGLSGFLAEVTDATGGSASQLTQLFGSLDAVKALLPLLSGDMQKFTENIQKQNNAAGVSSKAFDDMRNTIGGALKEVQSSFQNLVTAFAPVTPAIIAPFKILAATINVVSSNIKALAQVAVFFGAFVVTMKSLLIVFKAYQAIVLAAAAAKKALGVAAAFFQAVMNPAALAQIGVALAVATGAAVALGKAMETSADESDKAKGKQTEVADATKDINDQISQELAKLDQVPEKIDKAKISQDAKTVSVQNELNALKLGTQEIDNQIKALEGAQTLQAKRFEVEKALNDLGIQRLQREYDQEESVNRRLAILQEILRQEIEGAKIQYNQAIERLKIEKQKLDLGLQAAVNKKNEIELEATLLRLKAQGIEEDDKRAKKIAEINEEADTALGIQDKVIAGLDEQNTLQQQILQEEAKLAEIKFESQKLTAQQKFEQKAVSDEIGLSQEQANILANNIASSIGVTNTLADSMANVAEQAANAATNIQNAINLQNMLRGGGNQNAGVQRAAEGAYWSGGFKAFANGGMVNQPTLGLVGEGGEPEYIIPASKMNEAMARYASGQRGSSVIPNAATSEAGSYSAGTSSINPVVNVTTGPVMNMNNSNYVSQADFLAGLQVASRQGAQMALATLQGNNSMRRSVGIR